MTADRKSPPPCFGDLETVFPEGDDNLRTSPGTCLRCVLKTECLRSAIQGSQGIRVLEANVDKAYSSGMMSFFERWARKKELDARRRLEEKE